MEPIFYKLKCNKCPNMHVEYIKRTIEEYNNFECAVCNYKIVVLSGDIPENVYCKCTICNCIFYNKIPYVGNDIKCFIDKKKTKKCEKCNTTKNDTNLRQIDDNLIYCCEQCI
jgi:hypothetical protein